jgi:hypothetical protein
MMWLGTKIWFLETTMKKIPVFYLILIIAGFYLLLTLSRVNTVIFDTRMGYVYHPTTDRLYEVEIKPSVSGWGEIFNPFSEILYFDIRYAELLGNLQALVAEHEVNARLVREDPNAWRNKRHIKLDAELKNSSEKTKRWLETGFESLDINFYHRNDLKESDLLPDVLAGLRKYVRGDRPVILAGDAVIVVWRENRQAEVELLNGAIFIRGLKPASEIKSLTVEFEDF